MTSEDKNRRRLLIEEMSQESQGGSSDGSSTPELFSMPPPTSTWAESKDPEQPDSEGSLPAALQFLENNGVPFTLVPRFVTSEGQVVTQKKLSVAFTVDTVVTSQDKILDDLAHDDPVSSAASLAHDDPGSPVSPVSSAASPADHGVSEPDDSTNYSPS